MADATIIAAVAPAKCVQNVQRQLPKRKLDICQSLKNVYERHSEKGVKLLR